MGSMMASQITNLAIVYTAIYSGADQRKHQSSASLAFVQGIRFVLIEMMSGSLISSLFGNGMQFPVFPVVQLVIYFGPVITISKDMVGCVYDIIKCISIGFIKLKPRINLTRYTKGGLYESFRHWVKIQ